jgi:hypothetical protein
MKIMPPKAVLPLYFLIPTINNTNMETAQTCEVVATLVPLNSLIALMMEAARTSETLVNFYHTTQRYNPEDSHLRTHRCENLKS